MSWCCGLGEPSWREGEQSYSGVYYNDYWPPSIVITSNNMQKQAYWSLDSCGLMMMCKSFDEAALWDYPVIAAPGLGLSEAGASRGAWGGACI